MSTFTIVDHVRVVILVPRQPCCQILKKEKVLGMRLVPRADPRMFFNLAAEQTDCGVWV